MHRLKFIVMATGLAMFAACALAWWDLDRPHVYRHETSPDGSWSVTVLRQRQPPYVESVDITARIQDNMGRVLFDEKIDNRDCWSDVDADYAVVMIDDERVRLGPLDWQKAGVHFELLKSDPNNWRGTLRD
jgi:hypothetical protein